MFVVVLLNNPENGINYVIEEPKGITVCEKNKCEKKVVYKYLNRTKTQWCMEGWCFSCIKKTYKEVKIFFKKEKAEAYCKLMNTIEKL